jgi:Flp pilus assembly pilin Flp
MKRTATRLVREERAQDLIEYALLAGLLAIACITGILQLTGILTFFATVGQALANAL